MGEKLKVSLDMDDMTFGELELFETVTGLTMSDAVRQDIVRDKDGRPVADPDDPKGRPLREMKMSAKAMMGMIWLALRRQDPGKSFEDVRNLKMNDIEFDVVEKDADPGNEVEPASE
jgi:hypothetical protein